MSNNSESYLKNRIKIEMFSILNLLPYNLYDVSIKHLFEILRESHQTHSFYTQIDLNFMNLKLFYRSILIG